jgi:dTDP-4-amino-4,6-dideoxygalactose transaminase
MSIYSVPYSDLSAEVAILKVKLMSSLETVLDSGRYILGPQVLAFEQEFSTYCQTKYSSGISNGTSALHLVLRAIGIKQGEEVITVSNSFVATAAAIVLAGGKPVFVDICHCGNMDPQKLEDAITSRTRAVIPVHMTGRPAEMKAILEIARRRNLFVLEDAAQAVGAEIDGKRVGGWGDAACFSMHPLKNLHAFGDAGMVTSNDADLIKRINKFRNHGLQNREQCDFFSFNSRLDEIQAAMLRVQLCHLEEWTNTRRNLAFRYNNLLRPYVDVPDEAPGERCVYQTYVIKALQRDELKQHLNKNGVEALIHYSTPIHLQPAAKELGYGPEDFPKTMDHVSKILSIPLYPTLTHAQQDHVAELISSFYKSQ